MIKVIPPVTDFVCSQRRYEATRAGATRIPGLRESGYDEKPGYPRSVLAKRMIGLFVIRKQRGPHSDHKFQPVLQGTSIRDPTCNTQ